VGLRTQLSNFTGSAVGNISIVERWSGIWPGAFLRHRCYRAPMGTVTNLLAALASATLAALLLVTIAYYEVGLAAETIRAHALSAAGLLSVTVAAASLLKRTK
jgi:hypothetical protein